MSAAERSRRTAAADHLCAQAYRASGAGEDGVALVAVGGYGRGELAPFSDLDLVLVHVDGAEVAGPASRLWYPLWDSGSTIDHSVRALSDVEKAAADDPRVALGLLDVRHLAGDPNLTLRMRAAVLARWRRDARERLPEIRAMVTARGERAGELAHAAVPDLKECLGGLRDATILKALSATWLVDIPHADLERSRGHLLDVRDALHDVAGRGVDRVAPELWGDLAASLGLDDDQAAQRLVRGIGRRLHHLTRLTWRRAEAVLTRPAGPGPRRPDLTRVDRGVALSADEVVLDGTARPQQDPLLVLRAATAAAERGVELSPTSAARLARTAPAPAEPWSEEARDLLVRLLASGRGLLAVWETLEETGALDLVLPEWDRVRLLPHASAVHRFTVDRHMVETCIEASALIRRVARPDVLMVAALLHDVGKGGTAPHSVAGEPVARGTAARLGFGEREVELVGRLVRWHLLLSETATSRDPEDPETARFVADRLVDVETLDLLEVLTEADARATAGSAWTPWRAGLVRTLAERVRALLADEHPAPADPALRHDPPLPELAVHPGRVFVTVEPDGDGSRVSVGATDRVGLLADVAAALALGRARVRAARAWSSDDVGVSVWHVAEPDLDPAVLRERVEALRDGRLDARARLDRPAPRPGGGGPEPFVAVHPDASRASTVIEVRADDRPGLLWTVCDALARTGLSVRSAHASTLGPQAVDVFYVQEQGAGALRDDRAAQAAHAVREALSPTDRLERSAP